MASVHPIRQLGQEFRVGYYHKDGLPRVIKGEGINEYIGGLFAEDLQEAINLVDWQLKYYRQGKQTNDIHGEITVIPSSTGSRVEWSGKRIAYIEYGAGAPAVGKYKGELPSDYTPQAEGHSGGEYWAYRGEVMNGWAPYAPYYKTYLKWSKILPKNRKKDIVNEINHALREETAKFVKANRAINIVIQ